MKNIHNINLLLASHFIHHSNNDDLLRQIDLIANHENPNDLIDWVDGVEVVERFETTYTCKDFMLDLREVNNQPNKKTVMVNIQIRMDVVNSEEVFDVLETMDNIISMSELESNPKILIGGISESDILDIEEEE